VLAFNKMTVIFDVFSAGWTHWIMVVLLLKQESIQGKPIMDKFLQPMLIGGAKSLQGAA